jgi:8-oxo-dGTP diphosphatase
MHACDEGELAWVDRDRITDLNIWEGDKIFLRLLREETPFFSLKLVYDGGSRLVSASLDGKKLAL